MNPRTRLVVPALASLTLLGACGVGGPEQGSSDADYPTTDVRVVIPYAAGGPTDLAGRAASECLGSELGQPFVAENVDGGAGAIGMSEAVSSEPDGYTLAVGTIGNIVVAPLVGEGVAYTREDVVPVGKIYEMPSAMLVPSDSPYSSVEELVEAAKKNPGEIKVATPGASTLYHVALQELAEQHGVEFGLVPFDGGAPAITAFLGGNVDAVFLEASESVLALDGDKGTVVATGSPEPVEFMPDVPTLASLGYDDLASTEAFFALAAPAGTPQPVLDTLSQTLETCLADEAVQERLNPDYVPDSFEGTDEVESELAEADDLYSGIF